MYHPDVSLQIAKQQQKEYYKIAEQARMAYHSKRHRSYKPVILATILGWIGDRLALLSHRSTTACCDVAVEEPAGYFPGCIVC